MHAALQLDDARGLLHKTLCSILFVCSQTSVQVLLKLVGKLVTPPKLAVGSLLTPDQLYSLVEH